MAPPLFYYLKKLGIMQHNREELQHSIIGKFWSIIASCLIAGVGRTGNEAKAVIIITS